MTGWNRIERGNGRPLVLLHGGGSSVRSWLSVIDQLGAHRRVIALDFPGFGDTPAPVGAVFTMDWAMEQLAAELVRLGLDLPVDLVGNSMGGWMALEAAKRGLARSVVALGPAGLWAKGIPVSSLAMFAAGVPLAWVSWTPGRRLLGIAFVRSMTLLFPVKHPRRVPAEHAIGLFQDLHRSWPTLRKALRVAMRTRFEGGQDITVPRLSNLVGVSLNPRFRCGNELLDTDAKGYHIPGGTPATPAFAANLPAFAANLHKQVKTPHMPAPRAIMAAALEGAQVDFDTAQVIESRYFVSLVKSPVARNMVQAFFFDLQKVQSGAARPADIDKRPIRKVGVLGAGMMGAGIAYVTAKAGIDVVLKDVSIEAAENGKAYSESLEQKALSKGSTIEERSKALLDQITPTADSADFDGVDFVIEAVFEKTELKSKVFQEIEDIVETGAVLGSTTSSLPISGLASAVKRPEDFIGIHFFSPVEKMDPVEIIRGDKTSDDTLARVIDYTVAIGKYPIVVNDGRGFFTTRVFSMWLLEAITMLSEGVDPATIEQTGLQAGYPAAPLQVADEPSFGTIRKIMDQTVEAARAEGVGLGESATAAGEVITRLIDAFGRTGKQGGAGFYDYVDGQRAGLWPGLRDEWKTSRELSTPFEDLQDRLMFIQVIETQKAYDDGVIDSDADANIGSIFGIGFPPWTGGVRQFVTGYPGGVPAFIRRADELAERHGARFEVPARLRV
jgi:3-hydroxyacyl-CoA dehydrogenase/enoyl-CoA hydratase/3-hydroxybutyryl-CoA epimerase